MKIIQKIENIPLIKKTIKNSIVFDILNPLRDKLNRNNAENRGGIISKVTIKKLLNKNNPIILDIGANNGDDSVEFLQHFKKAKVYSFEPVPENIKLMNENIGGYIKRHPLAFCKIYPVAVSNKDGETELLMVDNDPLLAQSSIVIPKNIIGKETYAGVPKKFDKKTKCKTLKIDTWAKEEKIDFIDFMWVDIEGAERVFIEGARETLRNKTRYLYTEYADDENFEGSPNVRDILNLLPEFRIVRVWQDNVFLENRKFDYLKK